MKEIIAFSLDRNGLGDVFEEALRVEVDPLQVGDLAGQVVVVADKRQCDEVAVVEAFPAHDAGREGLHVGVRGKSRRIKIRVKDQVRPISKLLGLR